MTGILFHILGEQQLTEHWMRWFTS